MSLTIAPKFARAMSTEAHIARTSTHTTKHTKRDHRVECAQRYRKVSHQHPQALSSTEFRDLVSTESSRRSHIYSPTISLPLTECPSRWNEYVQLHYAREYEKRPTINSLIKALPESGVVIQPTL